MYDFAAVSWVKQYTNIFSLLVAVYLPFFEK